VFLTPQRPLEALALIYWHDNDYFPAREALGRLIAEFPASHLAPGAMLRIAKIFEEERKLDSARAQYRRLAARYPNSDAAEESAISRAVDALISRTIIGARQRDSRSARAHCQRTQPIATCAITGVRARSRKPATAMSRASYSPKSRRVPIATIIPNSRAVASRRQDPIFRPASALDPQHDPRNAWPPRVPRVALYHIGRLQMLNSLGLKELLPAEWKAVERVGGDTIEMRRVVLAGFANADAWYDADRRRDAHGKNWPVGITPTAERVLVSARVLGSFPHRIDAARARSLSRACARSPGELVQSICHLGFERARPDAVDSVHRKKKWPLNAESIRVAIRLYDPTVNVDLGTTYLKNLFEMFSGGRIPRGRGV